MSVPVFPAVGVPPRAGVPGQSTSTYCLGNAHDRCPRPRTCGCECHRPKERVLMVAKTRKPEIVPELVWEEPPAQAGRPSLAVRFGPVLAQLEADPKRWARIATYGTSGGASAAASSLRKKCPEHEFKAGDGKLYARYVGSES